MREFSVVLWATIIFCSDVANACTYHRPGACGVDHLISDNASKFSEVGGIGLFEDREVRSAGYRKLKMTLPPDAGQAIPLA
jgi:hypothetical protein